MKAAICYEFGKPLVVEDVELDPPKEGEVRVRLAATAICHSDIHVIRGELGFSLPLVPGHESAGYIEEVGPGVTTVKPGDAVAISLLASCRRCHFCLSGLPHLCEASWPLSKESRLHTKSGVDLHHMTKTATFAEYAVVHESQTVKVGTEIPLDRAALLACGVITGFGAAVNRARVRPMQSVVVIGTGGVGLNSIQGAALSGGYPVIAVDILESKLEAAKRFGATHTVKAGQPDTLQQIQALTEGRGADYVIITVGSARAAQEAIPMAGPRGMIIMVGLAPRGETITIPPMLPGERMLTGSGMGTTNLSQDVPKLVDLYLAGKLKLDELITERYPLERINEAIESVERGEALRNVIMFE